jgi:predicted 2-oxoglutarate/Fe(II)-dependent dioxygenase YbiX
MDVQDLPGYGIDPDLDWLPTDATVTTELADPSIYTGGALNDVYVERLATRMRAGLPVAPSVTYRVAGLPDRVVAGRHRFVAAALAGVLRPVYVVTP